MKNKTEFLIPDGVVFFSSFIFGFLLSFTNDSLDILCIMVYMLCSVFQPIKTEQRKGACRFDLDLSWNRLIE